MPREGAAMKALSIRQPWAHAILHAGKRIENRVWRPSFRGEFLIHASSACGRSEMKAALWSIQEVLKHPDARARVRGPLVASDLVEAPRGGIVGRARLVDVIEPIANPSDPWHVPWHFGLVLEDVEPLPFRPLRGGLGFFEVRE